MMRFLLRAKLEGQLFLTEGVSFERNGLLYQFIPDESGQIQEIAVSLKVPDEKVGNFAGGIGPGRGESVATFTIGGDKELREYLVSELQSLESSLAFVSGSVRRIRWDEPHQEFIAENPEEEQLITFTGFSRSYTYPTPDVIIPPERLIRLLCDYQNYGSLRIPMAFWREGNNYFAEFQYVQAFYQFYFIIEDFYAGGKSGESPVLKEFAKSEEFRELCDSSINEIFKESKHRRALEELFSQERCEISGTGLQKLLFKVRGRLHHFSRNSPRAGGTPFNQSEFESIALLTMYLTTVAIGIRIEAINRQS